MINLKCGDCLELLKDIPNGSIDLVVTDPPYEIIATNGGGSQGHKVKQVMDECEGLNILNGFDKRVLDECMRVMKKPNIYIWCNARQIPMYLNYFVTERKCNFDILVWIKDNPVPTYSNKYMTDKEYCLYFRRGGYCNPKDFASARTWFMEPLNAKDKAKYRHPTIKPQWMIERLVQNSCPDGGTVLDPFMGSGTSGAAAVSRGVNFIGFEINPEYFNIASERINNEEKNITLF